MEEDDAFGFGGNREGGRGIGVLRGKGIGGMGLLLGCLCFCQRGSFPPLFSTFLGGERFRGEGSTKDYNMGGGKLGRGFCRVVFLGGMCGEI